MIDDEASQMVRLNKKWQKDQKSFRRCEENLQWFQPLGYSANHHRLSALNVRLTGKALNCHAHNSAAKHWTLTADGDKESKNAFLSSYLAESR